MLELVPNFKQAPPLELAPLLRLKIWNRRPFQISAPHPSPEKKRGSVLGTIYETYTVLLMNMSFVIFQNLNVLQSRTGLLLVSLIEVSM